MNRCKICGGFLSMQRLWTQTGTETVEERWVTRQCKRCNPDPEYSEGAKRLIAKAEEENRRREIEEMRNLLAAMKEDDDRGIFDEQR